MQHLHMVKVIGIIFGQSVPCNIETQRLQHFGSRACLFRIPLYEFELEIHGLGELQTFFDKISTIPTHKE